MNPRTATTKISAGTHRHRLLQAYWRGAVLGCTDEEAATRAGLLRSMYWCRCGELRGAGLVVMLIGDDGMVVTRPGVSGRDRNVYVLTSAGRAVLAELKGNEASW